MTDQAEANNAAAVATALSVEVTLAVINTKLDLLLVGRDDHENRIRLLEAAAPSAAEQVDTEGRIRKLEQFKWLVVGYAAAVGGAVGAVVSKIN